MHPVNRCVSKVSEHSMIRTILLLNKIKRVIGTHGKYQPPTFEIENEESTTTNSVADRSKASSEHHSDDEDTSVSIL